MKRGRPNKGFVSKIRGKLYLRFEYKDKFGRTKQIKRRVQSVSEANSLRAELLPEVLGGQVWSQSEEANKKVSELCDWYELRYAVAPQYVNGKKVFGMSQWKAVPILLKPVKEILGNVKLENLTYSHLEDYRNIRLTTKTAHNKQRSIRSVNRELNALLVEFSGLDC